MEAELRAYNSYPDTEEVNARFAGKNWWDIPDAVLIDHVDPPTLLAGVNAFQYYLPAMLLAAIRYPDSFLVELLILSFQAPKKPEKLSEFRRRFIALNATQRRAVAAFLAHWLNDAHYENIHKRIRRMLRDYWDVQE
jgi:hypothetical protein